MEEEETELKEAGVAETDPATVCETPFWRCLLLIQAVDWLFLRGMGAVSI